MSASVWSGGSAPGSRQLAENNLMKVEGQKLINKGVWILKMLTTIEKKQQGGPKNPYRKQRSHILCQLLFPHHPNSSKYRWVDTTSLTLPPHHSPKTTRPIFPIMFFMDLSAQRNHFSKQETNSRTEKSGIDFLWNMISFLVFNLNSQKHVSFGKLLKKSSKTELSRVGAFIVWI